MSNAALVGLFSVCDKASGLCANPFPARSQAEALRIFGELVNDSRTQLYKHSEDYFLKCVGVFDCERGYVFGFAGEHGPHEYESFDFISSFPASALKKEDEAASS